MAFSFGGNSGGGGAFGSAGTPAAAKPFSFGASAAPAAAAPSAAPSFSFGAPAASTASTSTSTGTTTTSLFGGQQQQQQQPAATTTSTTGGSSSLFSGFGQQQQAAQTATPAAGGSTGFSFGGFGAAKPAVSTTPAAGAAPSTGLFGSLGANTNGQQQQQNKPTFSFGAPATGNAASTTSVLNFGASTSQQPSQQQQQQGSQSQGPSGSNAPITKSTKFEDLPEPARKMIEEIETYIQGRNAIYDSLSSLKLGSEIEETSRMLRSISLEFSALSNHLNHDAKYTGELRGRFESSLRDAVKAVQIVDSYRAPVAPGQGLGGHSQSGQGNQRPHPTFLQEFFRRKAEDLSRRLGVYRDSIAQVQAQLSRSDPDVIKSLLPTLRAQHSATLQLASRLSQLEQGIGELKAEYRDLWRERTGSVRDPFIERRREVLGSEAGVLESVGSMSIR